MKEVHINEFSFHEFLQQFQDAVEAGYRLDLSSNERFPQKYGSHLEVTLVLPEEEPVVEVTTTEDAPTEVPQGVVSEEESVKATRGRKKAE